MSTPNLPPATTSTIDIGRLRQFLWRLGVLALLVLATFLSSCGDEQNLEGDTVHDAAILEAHLDRTVVEETVANDSLKTAQDLGAMVAGGVIAVEGAVAHELDGSDFFSVTASASLRVTVALSFDAMEGRDLVLHLYVNGEPVGTLDADGSYAEREVELQTGDLLTMEASATAGGGSYELTVVDWGTGEGEDISRNEAEITDGLARTSGTGR